MTILRHCCSRNPYYGDRLCYILEPVEYVNEFNPKNICCLQEEPLVAVLKLRLRRPHGIALIVHVERSNYAFQLVRVLAGLVAAGFVVRYAVPRPSPPTCRRRRSIKR